MVKRTDEAAEFGLSLVTVRRTMAALEILADADASLSLSEIARRLDVNKNIALRILMTLEEENYIYRHVETKFYLAGFKVSNLGLRVLSRNRLLTQCQPMLRQLADECGELVLFFVIDHGEPRWVMAAVGRRQRLQIDPVTPLAPNATATGKAWLSTLDDERVAQVVKGKLEPLTPFTVTTITDARHGYAPDVPTLKEQGVDISLRNFFQYAAPKNLPPEVRATWESAIDQAVNSPEVATAATQAYSTRGNLGGAGSAAAIRTECAVWRRWIEEASQPRRT